MNYELRTRFLKADDPHQRVGDHLDSEIGRSRHVRTMGRRRESLLSCRGGKRADRRVSSTTRTQRHARCRRTSYEAKKLIDLTSVPRPLYSPTLRAYVFPTVDGWAVCVGDETFRHIVMRAASRSECIAALAEIDSILHAHRLLAGTRTILDCLPHVRQLPSR